MQSTVYFHNPGFLDIKLIEIMGLSIKETDHPIGRFGTGLKNAIAVLLRTGHAVDLRVGEERYGFSANKETARGVEFHRIYMNDRPLPFTTMLGRDWEVWQAYRELRSNAIDEGGGVATCHDSTALADTIFSVTGPEICAVHRDSRKVFLDTLPESVIAGVEIHAGPSAHVYYRGIRVHDLEKPSVKTYNLIDLTEDRTAKYPWEIESLVAKAILRCDDSALCAAALGRDENVYERSLRYHQRLDLRSISQTFKEAAAAASADVQSNESARRIADEMKQSRGFVQATLTKSRLNKLERAERMALRILQMQPPCEICVAEDLGPNVFGCYKPGANKIWISQQTLDMGVDFLATTILEEWLHFLGYEDFSRRTQDFLLQKLIQRVSR
jgi:hypothetical protein